MSDLEQSIEISEDVFLDGRLVLRQPRKGAKATTDAFFLAAAVPADIAHQESILEAGAGSGVVSLTLLSRLPRAGLVCVDIEPVFCALAKENAERNHVSNRMTVVQADVTAPLSKIPELTRRAGTFSHVCANPPFFFEKEGRPSPDALKTVAHRTNPGAIDAWIRFLTAMAAAHATITLIHAPNALTQILAALDGRFGNLAIFPLFPRDGAPAKRIVISGIKGSKAPSQLMPGLVLHKQDGNYTARAEAVLRRAEPLQMRKIFSPS